MKSQPPFPPWCRTVTVPYFDDDISKRAARDEDGKTYYVSSDMTYKHWYSKHVEPDVITDYDKEAVLRYLGGESYTLNEKLRDGVTLTKDEKDWAER